MVRLYLTFISLFFIFPISIVHAQVFPFVGEALSNDINVRAGQSANFERLHQLKTNEPVLVLEEEFGWYKIRLPQKAHVYIHAQYVKLDDLNNGVVTGNRVNLRARANTTSAILGQVIEGDKIRIIETIDKWHKIEPNENVYGWVRQDLLAFKSKDISLFDKKMEEEVTTDMAEKKPETHKSQTFFVKGKLEPAKSMNLDIQYKITVGGQPIYYVSGMKYLLNNFLYYDVELEGTIDVSTKVISEEKTYPVIAASKVQLIY